MRTLIIVAVTIVISAFVSVVANIANASDTAAPAVQFATPADVATFIQVVKVTAEEQKLLAAIVTDMEAGKCPLLSVTQRTMRDISLGGEYPEREVLFTAVCTAEAAKAAPDLLGQDVERIRAR